MSSVVLLALAERCEAAAGPDSKLDREIAVASGQYIEGRGRDGMLAPVDKPNEFSYGKPDFTASIDAALTLVPEGWEVRMGTTGWAQCLRSRPLVDRHDGDAATLALAICAAALRARAAQ